MGGQDAGLFDINASTGAVTFKASPNFEAPADAGANNVYDIVVQASDRSTSASQVVSISVTDANEAPSITSGATATTSENISVSTVVYGATATDPDAGAVLTYQISGGADAGLFDINASTGAVTFKASPNFEAPADAGANNVYDIVVQASDGSLSASRTVAISVTNANEAPSITSGATATISENVSTSTVVYGATATDPDAGAVLTYQISGGADAGLFDINASTGAVTFKASPNFEAPADAGANNVYDIVVQASDGSLSASRTVAISVTNANEAPSITSGATATISENVSASTVVYGATATDPDAGAVLTYQISGGADAGLFDINASTGAVTFKASPNFEAPADAGANNVYDIVVQASDGSLSASRTVAISVTNANEAPSITSGATATTSENISVSTVVYGATATDPDAGAVLTYQISGGADAGLFDINASTGAVTFKASPNFEAPADAGANNVYDIVVQASDGSLSASRTVAISVTNANEAPSITSGATATISENVSTSTVVYGATATDPDAGAVLTYQISGGADAGLFDINASTGAVTFKASPNFEAPADAGANNVYDIVVQASDGSLSASRTVAISVTNANEAPSITSGATATISENVSASTVVYGATATDPDAGAVLTYQISGGADAGLFDINASTGAVTFKASPNFEAPADAGANNVYDIVVQASDGSLSASRTVAISVTNANEAPSITSGATATISENVSASTVVYGATATDPDAGAVLTYQISGGADAGLFDINASTGAVTFKASPNFEAPADAGANNVYDIVVQASDGSLSASRTVAISVTNANEAPSITSGATATISENVSASTVVYGATATDPDAGAVLTYQISGGADAGLFDINASTGAVTFKASPNFEAPADAGANNVYDIVVQASDGSLSASRTVAISVTNANEAPSITSGATATISENVSTSTVVYGATATDPDAGAVLTYQISGGADAGLFDINASTGAVTFKASPNFEAPADAGANNVYDIVVQASDGSLSASRTVAISVTNANEAPSITSGATATISENVSASTVVYGATATDPDAGAVLTYQISGGADAGLFDINASTGAVTFKASPNFEAPADAGANNVYDIVVQASDRSTSASQVVSISVTDANEAPSITSGATATTSENISVSTVVYGATATDPDAGAVLTYQISGGADAGLFDINASTGAVTFKASPNFEAPADAGANNVYDIVVQASDGSLSASRTVAISVTNANEAPSITSGATATISENVSTSTVVYGATATDPDAGAVLTYQISGGADAGLFDINASTGAVTFKASPNFEAPADAGANNVYDIVVQASDGSLSASRTVAISVTNANEAPSITSGATATISENVSASTVVYGATATDPDAGAVLTYQISGGADAGLFDINASTGAVTFKASPNFEAPADAGANNVYDIVVQASDGSLSASRTVAISVTNANEAPSITSGATATISENVSASTVVYGATATDPDAGAVLTYQISGGADAGLFDINASTGAVTFKASPNFEAPADAGANNVYDIVVQASDGSLSASRTVAISVTNANEAPSITSGATATISENVSTSTVVYGATATDPDAGAVLTYQISGGADAGLFDINASTGAVTFKASPNFEAPADAGANNVYDIVVQASDGSLSASRTVAISVTNANDAPTGSVVISGTAGLGQQLTVSNTLTDQDGLGAISYQWLRDGTAISGAVGSTYTLIMKDAGATVTVQARYTDGLGNFEALTSSAASTFVLTQSGVAQDGYVANGLVWIDANNNGIRDWTDGDGNGSWDLGEGEAWTLTDQGGNFSGLVGNGTLRVGSNPAGGSIDISTGKAFTGSFAAPSGSSVINPLTTLIVAAGGDSGQILTALGIDPSVDLTTFDPIAVINSSGAAAVAALKIQAASIQVANIIALATSVSSAAQGSWVSGNAVANSVASSLVLAAASLSFGGLNLADASVISDAIERAATVVVTSASGLSSATAQISAVAQAVAAVNDVIATAAQITGGVSVASILNDISGAQALAQDTLASQAATAVTSGSSESITITSSNAAIQAAQVLMTLERPPWISSAGLMSSPENVATSLPVYTIVATDPDAGAVLTYQISGGADAGLFDINASTGAVTFKASPNFEAPADAGANNVYDIVVQASDGSLSASRTVAISVTNANEAPSITSGATATISENVSTSTVVYGATATDPDAGAVLTYQISGGADAGLFDINASTGAVTFKASPNFEAPADAGANNVYDITVRATDGSFFDDKAVSIMVTDMPETVYGSLHGIDYFWKANTLTQHALLSGVTNNVMGCAPPAQGVNVPIQLKNITWNATGHVSADVYAHLAVATTSMDIHIGVGVGTGALFTSSLTSDWILMSNQVGNELLISGYSITPLAPRDVKVGAITFETGSASQVYLSVDAGTTVGDVKAIPYGYNLSHSTTGADGAYTVNTLEAGSYTVTATRPTSDIGTAITSADALAALKIAVAMNPNPGTGSTQLPVSPFQIMAADANQDGKVTSADALAILKMAVHITNAVTPEWMFVEETRDLSGITRATAVWDHNINLNVAGDTVVNLVGFIKGDVNGSWTPPIGTQYVETTDPSHFTGLYNTLHIPMSEWGLV